MARATAPMFKGFRVSTNTTRRFAAEPILASGFRILASRARSARRRDAPLLFEVGVSVQPILIESQQPPRFLVPDLAFAQRGLHVAPELLQQRLGVELHVVQHFPNGVALH